MPVTARAAAAMALERFRKSGMRSENALSTVLDSEIIDSRDAALAARIFYSVIQNLYYIDAVIEHFSSVPLKKIQPKVMDIIRICCCQILFFDRVPDFSAVNEAVDACKRTFPKAAGFVNAVCRKISGNKESLPIFGNTDVEKLSIRYSHPRWFVSRILSEMSYDETEAFLKANNSAPPAYLHYNPLKCTAEEFEKVISEYEGVAKHPYLDGCYCAESFGALGNGEAFKSGMFYVQDPAAKMAVMAAAPKCGDTVIDVCAAPGGKSVASALIMNNRGRIFSFDIGEKKLPMISESANRLGIEIISVSKGDGRVFIPELSECADVVIADVPCSGFGVIRKKPEIRFKEHDEVANLPQIQLAILNNASRYVKSDGTLLYSTCTVLKEENEDVVLEFLKHNNSFVLEEFSIPAFKAENGMKTLYPHINDTDGFFICKLRRVK